MKRRELGLLIVLVLLCVGCTLKDRNFIDPRNINSILLWMPLLLTAAIGQFPVIVIRGIDISIGSIIGLSAISTGVVLKSHPNLPLLAIFLIGALVGVVLGLLNGSLITYAKIPAVVTTIGTLTLFRGLTYMVCGGDQIDASLVPDRLTVLAHSGLTMHDVTVSWLLIIALVLAVVTALLARYSQFFGNVFAYGSNPSAAFLRGISPHAVQMACYTLSGLTGGIAGVMFLSRFGNASPASAGAGFELQVIASVAIGGVKITGGSGSSLGVVLGCALLAVINVALIVLKIPADYQTLVYGITILVALLIDAASRRRGLQGEAA